MTHQRPRINHEGNKTNKTTTSTDDERSMTNSKPSKILSQPSDITSKQRFNPENEVRMRIKKLSEIRKRKINKPASQLNESKNILEQ